jgi:hypothetical protein
MKIPKNKSAIKCVIPKTGPDVKYGFNMGICKKASFIPPPINR